MKILVTGAAGFIGFHLVQRLLENPSMKIVGLDCINNYYSTDLKYARLTQLGFEKAEVRHGSKINSKKFSALHFLLLNLTERAAITDFLKEEQFDIIFHLAAQAGVRYSLENPYSYIENNIDAFINILEPLKNQPIKHFLFASSSSVYGNSTNVPYSENARVDQPVSLYAATKISNELMAHTYSHLYGIPITGLRFFTVYGPWGRPDMAYFSFTRKIISGDPIDIFNHGNLQRDFTYVDDIVRGMQELIEAPFGSEKYRIVNIGNHEPVKLLEFIKILQEIIGIEAKLVYKDMQPGDVYQTFADVTKLQQLTSFAPSTPLRKGLEKFVTWYRQYYA